MIIQHLTQYIWSCIVWETVTSFKGSSSLMVREKPFHKYAHSLTVFLFRFLFFYRFLHARARFYLPFSLFFHFGVQLSRSRSSGVLFFFSKLWYYNNENLIRWNHFFLSPYLIAKHRKELLLGYCGGKKWQVAVVKLMMQSLGLAAASGADDFCACWRLIVKSFGNLRDAATQLIFFWLLFFFSLFVGILEVAVLDDVSGVSAKRQQKQQLEEKRQRKWAVHNY